MDKGKMTMKQNKFFLMLTMLIVALVLASCSKSMPDYAKIIPKDASAVARIDVRQISKKSGFGDNDKMKGKLEKLIKENLSGALKKKVQEIIEDPAEAGLDLRDPILIYAKPDNTDYGILGTIYKAEKFEELLNAVAKEMDVEKVKKASDDLRYFSYRNILVTFNDDWFAITHLKDDDAKKEAKEIANRCESDKKSIVDNEAFCRMCEKDGLAQLYVNGKYFYDIAPELFDTYIYYSNSWDEEEAPPADDPNNPFDKVKEILGIDIQNVNGLLDFTMNDGEMALTAELISTKDNDDKLIEDVDRIFGGKDEGTYLRLNFGFIDQIAKKMSGYEAKQAEMVSKLLKYIEVKYEGNAKVTARLVTNDSDHTPIQTILEIVKKEYGF